ncbi:MAG TPA: cupredoxin domain-containing protein [Actinomycetota bacterium]|nr:cupredoxin domain-containing protein [Actinomycetota bacterium]
MDPEQIYQEVLSEEQGKGSPSAVAEARAKAARQRARHGSPHPKEPRWWPGSQPQFEGGGDGAAPAPEAEAEPEPVAEEAPAEEPAATPPDIGDASQSERPDAPAPAPAAGTETTAPAPQPAAAPAAAAAVATAPAAAKPAAQARPAGVTHGTDSGNRLRPEDSVGTDAQFDAQKAMADRRRLIDELVSTGVPAATAANAGRPKAPMLLLAYVLIPLIAIGLLAASDSGEAEAEPGGEAPAEQPAGPTERVVAESLQFDTETITLVANEPNEIEFENADSAPHNIAIYQDEGAGEAIFEGEQISASTVTYEIEGPEPGEYYFQCDVHPDMNGTAVSE